MTEKKRDKNVQKLAKAIVGVINRGSYTNKEGLMAIAYVIVLFKKTSTAITPIIQENFYEMLECSIKKIEKALEKYEDD